MRALLLVLLALTASVFPLHAQEALPEALPDPPTGVERVIVISLDGARPDAIQQANTPTLHRLAAEGAVDWAAQTVDPAVTLPAHAAMLTGLSVAEHGVDYNSTLYDADGNCAVIEPPTFVTIAVDHGLSAAMVVGKEKFCIFRQRETVDYTFAREGDRSVADRVIELLAGDDAPQVLFVHFPNSDYFGHSTGWMSETYLNEFYSTDFQVGRLIAALDDLNLSASTLVIITADHGGHDLGHGTTLAADTTIPWIAYGAGIAPGTILRGVRVGDTAPTVLWALGLPLPDTAASRPITEAFIATSPLNPLSTKWRGDFKNLCSLHYTPQLCSAM